MTTDSPHQPRRHRTHWNLHLENVALKGQVAELRRDIRTLERIRRCGYCGATARPGRGTCGAHSDLPEAAA